MTAGQQTDDPRTGEDDGMGEGDGRSGRGVTMPRGVGARDGSALSARAAVHHALSDPGRLEMVDHLLIGDRSPGELAALLDMPSNLLAFHLAELERAGIVERRRSEGDARRRYVRLAADAVAGVPLGPARDDSPRDAPRVLFVCTANQARSPLAAALWRALTGTAAESAGTRPADSAHPLTRRVAEAHGLRLEENDPRPLDEVAMTPDLVVSVCDRAHEEGVGIDAPALHWSVPDPVGGGRRAFERALVELEQRIDRLAAATSD